MALTARDVMQSQVVTLSPDDPLENVQRLFFEEEIHGAPVVSDDGRVLGMLTSMDLLRAASENPESLRSEEEPPAYVRELFSLSESQWMWAQEDFQEQLSERVVEEVMTTSVVTVPEDTPVAEVARTLRENRIHRVLVVEDGTLKGIISTFDLVGLLEKES